MKSIWRLNFADTATSEIGFRFRAGSGVRTIRFTSSSLSMARAELGLLCETSEPERKPGGVTKHVVALFWQLPLKPFALRMHTKGSPEVVWHSGLAVVGRCWFSVRNTFTFTTE